MRSTLLLGLAAILASTAIGCKQFTRDAWRSVADEPAAPAVAGAGAPVKAPTQVPGLSPAEQRERFQSAEARFGDGMEAYYAGDLDGAIRAFREVAHARPFLAEARLFLGRCYREHGWRDAAVVELQRAIELDSNGKEAVLLLAELHEEAGKTDEAFSLYQGLQVTHPHDPRVLTAIASHLSRNGKDPRAPSLFRKALSLRPDYTPAFRGLIDYYASKGTPEDVDEVIRRVAAGTGRRVASLFVAAGEVFLERDEYKQALAYFRKAGDLEPYSPMPYERIGDLWLRLGRPREALPYLRTGLDYNPHATSLRERLADAYRRLGESRLASLHYRRALCENPRSLTARVGLIDCYLDGDAVDFALAELTRARKLHPDNSSVHYRLGLAYERQGASRPAIVEYRRALELEPNLYAAALALEGLTAEVE
ncbi:MAG: tetratricopeptide repeat protein [Planctomycetes bacterium]|nr:tetratricopeptide repeat protein [Planctomycetota bacterium]